MSDRHPSSTPVVPDPDPSPLLGPPSPDAVPATRRNRWNLVLGAAAVVVLVGAGALAYRAHRTDAEASDLRADAAMLDQQSDQLAQRADQSDAAAKQLDADITAAHDGLSQVDAALDFATQMQDAYADVANKAADLYNHGHVSAAHDVLQGDGAAALAAFQQSVAALDHVLADAQAAVQHLQEADHV